MDEKEVRVVQINETQKNNEKDNNDNKATIKQGEVKQNDSHINLFGFNVSRFILNVFRFILLFLLVLLIAYFRIQYSFGESVWVDESVYMWQGYRLLHSPSLMLSLDYYGNTPFPLLVMAFFNLFTNRLIAGRLTVYFFSLLGIFLVYLIGRMLKDEYVGFLAALLLTFNQAHWFFGSRTLMDIPEATMVSLCVYLFLRYEKERSTMNLILLLLSLIATVETKIPAILIFPAIALYYFLPFIIAPRKFLENIYTIMKEKTSIYLLGGTFFIFLLSLFFDKERFLFFVHTAEALSPRITFIVKLPAMFSYTVIFFLIIGILLILFYRKWDAIAILCVFFTYLGAFSLFPSQSDVRHILPIVPLGMIIASFAYFELSTFVKPFFELPFLEWGLLIIGCIFVISLYDSGIALNNDKSYSYTGYYEAGQWLAENLPNGSLAYVSSQGPIRLFSGLGYRTENGPLRQIQTFGEGRVPNFSKAQLPIYLHIDTWERGPTWSSPITKEKLQALQAQGFKVVKTVTRKFFDYDTEKLIDEYPVHIFLVKTE